MTHDWRTLLIDAMPAILPAARSSLDPHPVVFALDAAAPQMPGPLRLVMATPSIAAVPLAPRTPASRLVCCPIDRDRLLYLLAIEEDTARLRQELHRVHDSLALHVVCIEGDRRAVVPMFHLPG